MQPAEQVLMCSCRREWMSLEEAHSDCLLFEMHPYCETKKRAIVSPQPCKLVLQCGASRLGLGCLATGMRGLSTAMNYLRIFIASRAASSSFDWIDLTPSAAPETCANATRARARFSEDSASIDCNRKSSCRSSWKYVSREELSEGDVLATFTREYFPGSSLATSETKLSLNCFFTNCVN